MGVTFSCLLADMDDLDSQFEAVLLRSISFNDGDMSTALRSVSFNGQDSEHSVMKSYGSGKIIFEGSLSFKGRELETAFSFKTPTADAENNMFLMSPTLKNGDEGDQLAIFDNSSENKLHPSTLEPGNRRYQAALKLQKVYKSFRTRRKLADCAVLVEQRWWKLLDFAELKRSSISFFDIEKPETAISRWSRARTRAAKVGKGLSKDKKARKLALQHWLEAAVWPHSGHYLPTEENFEEFMSYLKEHDIDLAGVKKSPTEEEEEELFTIEHRNSIPVRADLSEDVKGLAQENSSSRQQNSNSTANCEPALSKSSRRGFGSKIAKLDIPKRADMFDIFKTEAFPPSLHGQTSRSLLEPPPESFSEDGYETAEESFLTEEDFMVPKVNLFGEDEEEEYEKPIPKEKIMKRIDSHKVMNSYQLAQHLSSKWTTGAGPRIGCMRDYPSELQFRVLEQANLSPRSRSNNASPHTTNRLSPSPLSKETSTGRSPLAADKMSYS
ncbi:hypothetical protein HS088_TW03G00967 [Tripterygium wilfordii]|uniref:Uncharacterized protein n=1 Tax=Tripterygium wilfordii TaxID=458696 RepID=A0A7J7DW80_TRIWF|nr:hypothetical protein HS088_TW03G00967 [Tripterygium wilfordii]